MTSNPSERGPKSPASGAENAVTAAGGHVLEEQRRANREELRKLGLRPYGSRVDGLLSLAKARALQSDAADAAHAAAGKTPPPGFVDPRAEATVAGRVMLLRDNGKLLWMTLRDETGDLQIAVSQRDVSEKSFAAAKLTDLGDVVCARGRLMKTRTGEITLWAERASAEAAGERGGFAPASKCLLPPPEKHAGLVDVEIRYRQRYVDLWANPETLGVFRLRSAIIARLRKHMESRGYLEVETPMLQALAGGAAARPFITKMNALDISLYMRIAPELYLKRLLVGGLGRVFEINRNFRNEGLDKQHNPEFTMMEAYHAFGDVETVMELTESAIRDAASMVFEASGGRDESGEIVLPFGDLKINYSKPFVRVTYAELFEAGLGYPMDDFARAKRDLSDRNPHKAAEIAAADPWLVVNELFELKGEGRVDPSRPTFITDYPSAISPLTRPKPGNEALADRADLFVAGMEIAPHYTELNDPDVQEARFREQLKGIDADKNAEESTFRTMDHDFLRALKVGMPPAGGMGLGVDRLVMILTNQRTIRDVMLFPLMRPEA